MSPSPSSTSNPSAPVSRQTLHTFGALMMWGSIAMAVAGVFAVIPRQPGIGMALVALALPAALCGGWLKKRYCPRCADDACEVPGSAQGDSGHVTPER